MDASEGRANVATVTKHHAENESPHCLSHRLLSRGPATLAHALAIVVSDRLAWRQDSNITNDSISGLIIFISGLIWINGIGLNP
jgi:hypothetical protein